MGAVIKRSGRRQAFSAAKVRRSVQRAAREARISTARTRELMRDVSDAVVKRYKGRKTVKTTDLRRAILGRLDRRVKYVSAVWRRYDRKRRRR